MTLTRIEVTAEKMHLQSPVRVLYPRCSLTNAACDSISNFFFCCRALLHTYVVWLATDLGPIQIQRYMSPSKCLPDVTFAKGKPAGARPAMLTLLCSAALVLGAWPCAGASIASLVSDPLC